MRNTLKGLLIVLIIAIIGVLAWTGKIYFDEKQKVDSVANNKTETNASSNENKAEEKVKEEPKKEEPVEEPKKEEPEKEEKVKEETSTSNEEKAIELAKKEYGITDGGIYYRIDQIKSNTEYIVSVRNRDTSVLAWYVVDVSAGTVKDY